MCEKESIIVGGHAAATHPMDHARKQSTMCDSTLGNEHGGGVGGGVDSGASGLEEVTRKVSVEDSAENATRELEVSHSQLLHIYHFVDILSFVCQIYKENVDTG